MGELRLGLASGSWYPPAISRREIGIFAVSRAALRCTILFMHRRTVLSLLAGLSAVHLGRSQYSGVAAPYRQTLTDRGVANLAAFARLFGYIRDFHPTDEAARTDWDILAIAGVEAVESAEGSRQLASTLNKFFARMAPTLRVFPDGERLPAAWHPETALENFTFVTWRHHGFGPENPEMILAKRTGSNSSSGSPSFPGRNRSS